MKEEMKPIEISNTDRACEVLHGIDFTNAADMITAIARVEVLFDTITTLRSRVKELEESKWISVEDRLPEFEKDVLLFDDWKTTDGKEIRQDIRVGYLKEITSYKSNNGISNSCEWGGTEFAFNITHWQPLPEPPTK